MVMPRKKNLRPERTPVYACLDCGMEITGFTESALHIIEELHRTVEVGVAA